jgi:hypothetical protein
MDLQSLLQGQLGSGIAQAVAQQAGLSPQAAEQAIQVAMPLLMGSLAKNAESPDGAEALLGALSRDHDGSVLQDTNQLDLGVGAKILGHIFGGKQQMAEQAVSQNAGIDMGQSAALLKVLAPVVMGVLGQQQRQQGLDSSGLAGLLGGILQQQQGGNSPMAGLLSQFLDQNHDGSMVDDVAKMGMNILGKLFK